MYLGITLNRLNDFESACSAFNKSIELDQSDCIIFLNYAIVLFNNEKIDKANEMFRKAEEIYKTLDEEDIEPEMMSQRQALAQALNVKVD
mmetsp:Transcript_27499/g.24379  ORF Transcript_27499/g.24379 Transcript_27499/m.24379 type:complete len:90 (-) Transcript_27499:20-289(-)